MIILFINIVKKINFILYKEKLCFNICLKILLDDSS